METFAFVMLFPFAQLIFVLFGKRTMTLDHGYGTTFVGVGPIGARQRFEYGGTRSFRQTLGNLV